MSLRYEHLLHRPFLAGVRDCLELVRDLYRDNFEIEITNYARPHDWNSDNFDLIRQLHEREGFRMITDWTAKELRPADLLCVAVGSGNPNHLAVYVGDNLIVHHLSGKFSNAETYRDFWRTSTCFVLRHDAVPDLRPVFEDTDIRSILRDRYDRVAAAG